MSVAKNLFIAHEPTQIYPLALARLEKELGWTPNQAHNAIAQYAAFQGVFLDDVARAILEVRSMGRGLGHALRGVPFDRRCPALGRAAPSIG